MKKKITIILVVLLLLTPFTGCGGVKEEAIIGEWVQAYYETKDGTRREDSNAIFTFKKDGILEIKHSNNGDIISTYTWEISGSNVTFFSEEGKELDTYKYINSELVLEFEDGSKLFLIKQ